MNATLNDESIRANLRAQGVEPAPGTPEAFAGCMGTEAAKWAKWAKWAKVIRSANSQLD